MIVNMAVQVVVILLAPVDVNQAVQEHANMPVRDVNTHVMALAKDHAVGHANIHHLAKLSSCCFCAKIRAFAQKQLHGYKKRAVTTFDSMNNNKLLRGDNYICMNH